jgi:hypothetical protein
MRFRRLQGAKSEIEQVKVREMEEVQRRLTLLESQVRVLRARAKLEDRRAKTS